MSAPDWSLIRAITRYVAAQPGGGLHRAELAAHFQLPPQGPSMRDALGVAYKRGLIDFCGQFVVAPIHAERKPGCTA